jgi:hypothetical protein
MTSALKSIVCHEFLGSKESFQKKYFGHAFLKHVNMAQR